MANKPKDTGSGKPRADKLGIKPGARVYVRGGAAMKMGVDDDIKALSAKRARTPDDADWILLGIGDASDLPSIPELRGRMRDDCAIWVVWPKGNKDCNDNHVRATALALDLVDVKVMSWSPTHTGLKLVVRKSARKPEQRA
ncbi:MAG TPA: hypothetical protein VGO62_11095 [Myxococcota bacterium]|jgi:hypothetical protein